ncbi:MAG: hypothetical protein HFJ57_02675 [Clostridia bacterium]|nr:hypothetical protein [Clostridia bacterium]
MKKILICLIIVLVATTIAVSMWISGNNTKLAKIKENNQKYEIYLDKEVFGTDVTTVINKAIDDNEKREIPKDEKGFFIQNDTNSIKVELVMLNGESKETYQMETLNKVGLSGFIKNFNLINFKCSKIEYHDKTKLISKIIFEQTEE